MAKWQKPDPELVQRFDAAVRPFAPMGHAMKEYAAIEDALDCSPREFQDYVDRALAYARVLPAKVKKAAVRKAPAATRAR